MILQPCPIRKCMINTYGLPHVAKIHFFYDNSQKCFCQNKIIIYVQILTVLQKKIPSFCKEWNPFLNLSFIFIAPVAIPHKNVASFPG